jgi:hypothetical protein
VVKPWEDKGRKVGGLWDQAEDALRATQQADGLGESVEDADEAQAWQRPIDLDRDEFPREVVDDIQGPEAAAVRERVHHEIHRSALAAAAATGRAARA